MQKLLFHKYHIVVSLLLALVAASPSRAQKLILPSHFSNWSGQPGPEAVETEAPARWVNLWKETGRGVGEFCEYTSGGNKLDVSLQKYRDPTSAYEVYTAMINPEMRPSTVGGPSAIDKDHLMILSGNILLNIRGQQNASTADLLQLAEIVRRRSDMTPLPSIRTFLPGGFSDGTQRYTLGPAGFEAALESLHHTEYAVLTSEAGFRSSAEAMFAKYHGGKDEAVLLLIVYPTPQLAGLHLKHLEQALTPEMKQAGTTIAQRASLLSIVLAPTSQAYGENLRAAVNYETEVTWNEPTHTLTDPPILSTVAKIILFTGGFMVVAFVLGMAFGGVRILTKIFFPGKVFDRPEKMDVLQLGLTDKPIDFRDFY